MYRNTENMHNTGKHIKYRKSIRKFNIKFLCEIVK